MLTGDGRPMDKSLVEKDFLSNVLPDGFCTRCLESFAYSCCSDHALHHAGQVIHIVHHSGSILSPVQDLLGLPDDALVCIQVRMRAAEASVKWYIFQFSPWTWCVVDH